MTTRVALYARFSTDKQRETSIDDQLRAARARADQEAWPIVATHTDESVSGAVPLALRAGGKALLADALANRFEVLIIEGLDRLSREVGEQESIVKRLEHRGVRIIGTADGYDSDARGRKVMRIARGLVNELYLDDLREKTHRGLAGQFERGMHAGGRTYGYGSTPAPDGRGRHQVIDEAEAAVVREVFQRAAAGESLRVIAHDLNARGIKSARGGTWAVSALVGNISKGQGLMHNELYTGRVIWNRRQWLKDPDTGARRSVERPRHEWQIREAPELRIVDQATWDIVQARAQQLSSIRGRHGKGGVPRCLFTGLLRCAACGGAMVAVNTARYGCSVHKDRGPAVCGNSATVPRKQLDKRLVAELRGELLRPEAMADLQQEVRLLMATMQREAQGNSAGNRRRLAELDAEIERLVDAVAALGMSQALQKRLAAAEGERSKLQEQLATAAAPEPQKILEDTAARYKRMLVNLQQALEQESDRERTRRIISEMLGPVTIGKDGLSGRMYADLEEPAERLLAAAVGESLGMVAGAGFEPTTFGL